MTRLVLAATSLIWTSWVCADAAFAPSARVNSAQVAQLVEQLGDNNFQARTGAFRALELLGPEVLPILRSAATQVMDPEVRRRLADLIPTLEHAAALAPTRITIDMKDRPVREVVKDLARQSRYKIELWPAGGPNDERERRLVSIELKDAPFWEALERICEASGLSVQEEYWHGADNVQFRMQFHESYPGIHSIQGPFRVSARGFQYYRGLDFSHGPRNGLEGPFRRNETLSLNLGISAEPKLPLLGAGQPTLTEALDEKNDSLLPPPQARNPVAQYNHGYRTYVQHVQAQLLPSPSGRRVKSLKGTIPVTVVAAQKAKITVDKLLQVKKQTFKEGTTTLIIDEVAKNGNQITVKMSVSEGAPKGNPDYTWINSLTQRLEVFDPQGNKYRFYGQNWSNHGNNTVQGTFTFGQDPGRPGINPAALFGPAGGSMKLVYYEWTTLSHAVPFEFRDLPLP